MSKQDCFYNPFTETMWEEGETYRLHGARDGTEYVVTRKDIPALLVRIHHLNKGSVVETAAPLVVFYDKSPPGREWRWKERLQKWKRARTWPLLKQEANHEEG